MTVVMVVVVAMVMIMVMVMVVFVVRGSIRVDFFNRGHFGGFRPRFSLLFV